MKPRIAIRILIVASLYSILYMLYTFFSLRGSFNEIISEWASFLFILVLVILTGFTEFIIVERIRISLREKSGRSIPFLITGSVTILCILMFTILGAGLYKYLFFRELSLVELEELFPGFSIQIFLLSIFTGIVLAVADHNLDSFRHLQEIRLTTKKLQTQQVNLRFDSLRSQISPHFLFNSLNTISSLIYRDIQIAEKFIRNLASVYQSVLRNYEQTLVPLETEIQLVEHYSYLMQVRFEDAFFFDIDLTANGDTLFVPPLSIQMLMENAIKHNHMSQENPLNVHISIKEDYLVVSNNFIGESGHIKIGGDLYQKPLETGSTGIGLENIKNRYRLLSNKPILITKDESFTVSIPLISEDETEMVHK